MSLSSAGRESKAIQRPSGDQCGMPAATRPSAVNLSRFEPSLSHTQISRGPERLDPKAIRIPSGEICGNSSRVVVASTLIFELGLPGESGRLMRHVLIAWKCLE